MAHVVTPQLAWIGRASLVSAIVLGTSSAGAEPPADPIAPTTDDRTSDDEDTRLRDRAAAVRALMTGTLSPTVDADALFDLDAADPAWGGDAERWLALLAAITREREAAEAEAAKPRRRRRPPDEPPPPHANAADELVAAYAAFFAQPRERQLEQLDAHRETRAAARREAAREENSRARARELEAAAEQIEAFIAGRADASVDPRELMRRNLLVEDSPTISAARRTRIVAAAVEPTPPPTEPTDTPAVAPDDVAPDDDDGEPDAEALLRAAQDRYDKAWLALARLGREGRDAIVRARVEAATAAAQEAVEIAAEVAEDPVAAVSDQVIDEAEQRAESAAEEREQALAAARSARSESLRLLAEEHAALLAVKEAQARFAADLERRRARAKALHETTLEWQRRVAGLDDITSEQDVAADETYEPLREQLAASRNELRAALAQLGSLGEDLAVPGGVSRTATDLDRTQLDALRTDLDAAAAELRVLETDTAWEIARSVRDDTVAMNQARLRVLELASPRLRADVTGLGDAGADQVRRELDQIALELRYHARAWPRIAAAKWAEARAQPVGLSIGIAQLVAILAVFVGWRRVADRVLGRMRESMLGRGIGAGASNLRSVILYYVRRLRSPLEWLALVLLIAWSIGGAQELPEVRLLWLVLRWSLIGWTVILAVDAIAGRQSVARPGTIDTSRLRLTSLRLVGYTIVAVGLVLSLTAEIVGVGAIYGWVLSLCWFLLIPVVFRLVQRWRPVVLERMDAREGRDAVVRWVAAHRSGPKSYLGGFVGGAYLLGVGLLRWATRLLQGTELTRRLLAYLFRRSLTRRSREDDERDLAPLPQAAHEALGPGAPSDVVVPATDELEHELAALMLDRRAAMVAVVGERGSGKTTLLRRLASRADLGETIVVECPPGAAVGLFAAMGDALGTTADPEAIATAMRARRSLRVFIDDAQRLVRPAIGGLVELDHLAAFARAAGDTIDWVIAIGAPSWQYVHRARGDRMIFDRVVELRAWSDEQIGQLVTERSAAAGVQPSFNSLAVGGVQGRTPLPEDLERAERGFHRMLWDSSDGNPAVALEIWRSSLWVRGADTTAEVRLYREPAPAEIERLPLPALFVLRAVTQLERAAIADLVECTQLPAVQVAESISYCLARSYVERIDDRVRLSWQWYRTITRVLARQHLLERR